MTKENSETSTTSPKISRNERNKSAFAYFTTFLILLLPIGLDTLDLDSLFSSPFYLAAGGAVGALICGLMYWGNMRTSQFTSNHSRKAAKINIVCTIAITLITLLFFNTFDGPEALLPLIFIEPFLFGGPLIGLLSGISIYTQLHSSDEPIKESGSTSGSTNSLEKFINQINQLTLNESAEDYYLKGETLMAKGEFDEAILEYVKVIRVSSPQEKWYLSAENGLKGMGFSESDILQV